MFNYLNDIKYFFIDALHSKYVFSISQCFEPIMRDVNNDWLIRYIHANGASMFFKVP